MKHVAIKYAEDSISGEIPACLYHKQACQRFLRDIKKTKWRWHFDEEKANHAIDFIEKCLVLETPEGQKPFKLFDWQKFVLSNVYGFVSKKKPTVRRFREMYVEAPRGCGKSPTCAALAIYTTFVLGMKDAKGYCVAADSNQAGVVFSDIGKFAEHLNVAQPTHDKFKIFKHLGSPHIINRPFKGQSLRRMASDSSGRGKSGFITQFVSVDEIHEHPNSTMYDRFMSSLKNDNPTPLAAVITNSGVSHEGIAWILHQRSKNLLDRKNDYKNEREFAIIYTLDTNDDPYQDEGCWYKANPSLKYGTPSLEFYKTEVTKAKGSPSQEAEVNRALFSIWTAGASPWISAPEFESITTKNPDNVFPSEEELKKMRCYAGIDLSSNIDLTSITLGWKDIHKDMMYFRNHSFIPADNNIEKKERKDKSPYRNWEKEGYVSIIDSGVIEYSDIVDYIKDIQANYRLQMITLDSYRLHEFMTKAKKQGLPLYRKGEDGTGIAAVFCRQGRISSYGKKKSDDLSMPRLIEIFENKMKQKNIMIDYNPCLTKAAVSSMLVGDNQGNRTFNKEKSYSRIDPIVATVEAIGLTEKYGSVTSGSEITKMWLNNFQ